jgi:hypothetical protein
METKPNRYTRIIEKLFSKHYKKNSTEISFSREEIMAVAEELGIELPKNLGDVIYSFRYRAELPASISSKAPKGKQWLIRPTGHSTYAFVASAFTVVTPNAALAETKIPDATPGVIEQYALTDEQSLLAKLRYNRLIDIFTGITCYSLQSHLRTALPNLGQIETDEIYIGIDRRGVHYIIPVQAKGGKDKLGIVQIEQDFALCASKFSKLTCRPIAAQFMKNNLIALFEFVETENGVGIASEKHYKLVPPSEMTPEDLQRYRNTSE